MSYYDPDYIENLKNQIVNLKMKVEVLEKIIEGIGEENKRLFLSNIFMKDELETIKRDKWWY